MTVWARSGAWPPRAQTAKGESLNPVTFDHAARFLRHARTQLRTCSSTECLHVSAGRRKSYAGGRRVADRVQARRPDRELLGFLPGQLLRPPAGQLGG